jgi:ATP-dependent Clp protease ATP-binding subunit ClpC
MVLANEEAMRLQNDYIDSGHILVGLIREGSGVAANVLKNLGLDLHKTRQGVAILVQSDPEMVNLENIPRKPGAKKVIEYSMEEARKLNHNYVGTEHILLGLLCETEGLGAQVIIQLGLRLEDVRREVLNLLGHSGK